MTPSESEIESYVTSAAAGFGEIAESLLGAATAPLPDGERLTASSRFSAFVPVLADDKTIYVGVGSSLAGAVTATRSFLGFEPADDDPSVEDVADAVGELANMTAGAVQRTLAEYGKSELGLPVTLQHEAQLALDRHVVRGVTVDETTIEITVGPGPLRLDADGGVV